MFVIIFSKKYYLKNKDKNSIVQKINKIRLLIVDDSSFIRAAIRNIVQSVDDIIVVGEAKDGKEAVDLARELSPDIITMDVELPIMSGIEATKEINKYAKIPIIMLSSLTSDGADATLDALSCGAVDFITKKSNLGEFKQLKEEIIEKIISIYNSSNIKKLVHRNMLLKQNIEFSKKETNNRKSDKDNSTRISNIGNLNDRTITPSFNRNVFNTEFGRNVNEPQNTDFSSKVYERREVKVEKKVEKKVDSKAASNEIPRNIGINLSYEREDITNSKAYQKPQQNLVKIIFIGISTGGPAALQKIIPTLSSKINVPIFIVQHMPPNFTKSLANRLDTICKLRVKEAEHNEVVQNGTIYIGKGGFQMLVNNKGIIQLEEKKYENNLFAPSVEVTLDSLVDVYGGKILGLMMTGMGNDGKNAFKKLKQKGGFVAVQDFHSCVVSGMPKSVIDNCSVNEVIKLDDISEYLNSIFE